MVTRYRYDQFDAVAAEEFTGLLMAHLAPSTDSTSSVQSENSATPSLRILSVLPAPARRRHHRILGDTHFPDRTAWRRSEPAAAVRHH